MRQQGQISDDKLAGINVVTGVIGVAPAGHVHRRLDRELAQVCPHNVEQELQLVAPACMLDDVQAEDHRRPCLSSWEDCVLQSPLPFRPSFLEVDRIHGTGRVFTPETIVRRMERSVRRMVVEGRRDNLLVKLHPDVAMYVLEQERELVKTLQKAASFSLELRDDPLLKPDEFKLVVKGQGRDVTQQYAVA